MQDASDMQTTVTDLLNHHNVSLLDLAHMVNASPGAVCALVAGLLDDDELAEQLIHGLEQLIAEEETEDELDAYESEEV
jgi:hypothetical protein